MPRLFGLNPYEMIGEKIMACNRRQGGSSKDVYDLDLWAKRLQRAPRTSSRRSQGLDRPPRPAPL